MLWFMISYLFCHCFHFISIFEIWLQSSRLIFSCLLPNSMHLLMCCSPDHCSLTGGESPSLKHLYWAINVILTVHEDNVWMNSSLCVLQEEEVVQEEELQEEDQEVIETWTRNVKACTCDCESAESPTRTLAVEPSVPPTSLPSSFQGQPVNCMPGEESDCTTVTWPELTCSPLSHSQGCWTSFTPQFKLLKWEGQRCGGEPHMSRQWVQWCCQPSVGTCRAPDCVMDHSAHGSCLWLCPFMRSAKILPLPLCTDAQSPSCHGLDSFEQRTRPEYVVYVVTAWGWKCGSVKKRSGTSNAVR